MASFEKSQLIVGINEKGYQNDPNDKGNWYAGQLIGTNWGIAAPTLAKYLGRTPSAYDMKTLPRATAEAILKRNFWDKNNFGILQNQSVATMLYDGAVNQGVNGIRAIAQRALQQLKVSLSAATIFSIQGITLMNEIDQRELFYAIKTARANSYKASSQKRYINSWLRRLERIQFVPESGASKAVLGLILLIVGAGCLFLGF